MKAGVSAGTMTSRIDAPGAGAERAGGLFEARIELFHRRHDGEDHARDGEIKIAEKQALQRISEDLFVAEQPQRQVADRPCRPASRMIMKPTTTPGKASGKVSIAISKAWPGKAMALQKQCR